jgi:hypothetical protein
VPSRPAIAESAVAKPARNRERGGARLKTFIWLVIFIAFVYGSFEIAPVLFAEYEFQDDIQTTARYVPYNRATMDEVKASVLKSAQSHDLPVTPADITVVPKGYGAQIDVNYSVTVNLLVYQWTFNFHPSAASTSLT